MDELAALFTGSLNWSFAFLSRARDRSSAPYPRSSAPPGGVVTLAARPGRSADAGLLCLAAPVTCCEWGPEPRLRMPGAVA